MMLLPLLLGLALWFWINEERKSWSVAAKQAFAAQNKASMEFMGYCRAEYQRELKGREG